MHCDRFVILLALAGLVACSSGGSGGSSNPDVVTCDLVSSGIHICIAYTQPNATAAANQASSCKGSGASIVDQCSTVGLVGTCAYTDSAGIPEVVYTYGNDAGATTSVAKQVCDGEQGTFTPP